MSQSDLSRVLGEAAQRGNVAPVEDCRLAVRQAPYVWRAMVKFPVETTSLSAWPKSGTVLEPYIRYLSF